MPASAAVLQKAGRLVDDGRVRRLTPVDVFEVDGDSGRYTVVLCGQEASCTCPATARCSHVLAAEQVRDQRPGHTERVAISVLAAHGFEDRARDLYGDDMVTAVLRDEIEDDGLNFAAVCAGANGFELSDAQRVSGEAAFARL